MPAGDEGGEFALIRRYFSGLDTGQAVQLGVGDDAALLRVEPGESVVVSTDTQLDGVHFPSVGLSGSADSGVASRVAYRAVAAAVSDLAAMGARPLAMTLALTLPHAESAWLSALRDGLAAAADDFALPLAGGDTTRGPLALTVTVLGAVDAARALRRDGARPGDRLCVSGNLGNAAAGVALLQGRLQAGAAETATLIDGFWRPQPRLALGQALVGIASAAIDISDGLLADVGHIAAASGVCARIDSASLPLSPALLAAVGESRAVDLALCGGDDYELCFTLAADRPLPAGCRRIGEIVAGEGVVCDVETSAAGYEHFP